jgi:hypothetical protein
MSEETVSRHLTKAGANQSASQRLMEAGRLGGSRRHSSGHARLHYEVRPWLRVLHKVVVR